MIVSPYARVGIIRVSGLAKTHSNNEGVFPTFPLVNLPSGWASATIDDIVGSDGVFTDGDWVESKDQDSNGDVRLIQLADVGDGSYRNRSSRFLTGDTAKALSCTFLSPNDVLIARMPEPLGRSCIFPGDAKSCVTAVDICIVRTGHCGPDHRWLMHFVNSPSFRSGVARLESGTTRKRISRKNLARLLLPVPSFPEQHEIVKRIEELFTRLDAGVEALKKIQKQLKRYRQTVMDATVRGKMTEGWRATHDGIAARETLQCALKQRREWWEASTLDRYKVSGKRPPKHWRSRYKEPVAPDHENLTGVPDRWAWATVDQLCALEPNALTDGPFGSNLKTAHYTVSGPRVIRLQNIGDGAFVDEEAHISQEHFDSLQKHRVFAGDIVVASLGDSPPRACIVPESVGPAIVKADCLRFRPNPGLIDVRYALCALNAYSTRLRTKKAVHGIGRPRLNLTNLRAVALPLPPLAEQQQIVEEVERHFSVADAIERSIEQTLKQAGRLRQSILKRAFAGKLTEQWRHEHPELISGENSAEKLLERIKAEKAQLEAAQKTKRKTRRSQKSRRKPKGERSTN